MPILGYERSRRRQEFTDVDVPSNSIVQEIKDYRIGDVEYQFSGKIIRHHQSSLMWTFARMTCLRGPRRVMPKKKKKKLITYVPNLPRPRCFDDKKFSRWWS